jgi:hypothetical protein
MTRTSKRPTDRLTDALVEDILAASQADLLAEARADADQGAAKARAAFARACRAAALRRVPQGRAAARRRNPAMDIRALDPETARGWLNNFIAGNPETESKFASAARNSKALSDEDVYGMLESLQERGVLERGGLGHGRR